MIDSHCHLDSDKFDSDRDATIARARAAGVTRFLAIGSGDGPPDLSAALRLASLHHDFLATVGVHPHCALRVEEQTYPDLLRLAQHPKCVAIGEIGLDYYYDFAPHETQREVFISHLNVARTLALPVIIHTREAWSDTVSILRDHWDSSLGGIFHCFSEGPDQAQQALDLNFHLGLGGVLTFPKAEKIREAASFMPLDRLVLETDAPFLAPVPNRGKRNEPAFVLHTARRLAALRGLTLEELDEITTRNFNRLFPSKSESPQ